MKLNRNWMNKRGVISPLFILIAVGLLGAIVIYQTGNFDFSTGSLVTGSVFVNPDWARLECSPTDANEGILDKFLNQQTIFKCDGFTEECFYSATCFYSILPCQIYIDECDLSGSGCVYRGSKSFTKGQIISLTTLPSGKEYKFRYNVGQSSSIEIKQTWKPWKLYRFVGGSKYIVNSYNCDITSGSKDNILASDYPSVGKLYRQGGEGAKWVNYINAWNYGPATNVFTHPTYGEVYCNSAKIYKIVQLQMASGKLVKLNPSYSDTTESGDAIKGMGSLISAVECCPNEPNCGSDFKYVPVDSPDASQNQPNSCFTAAQCYNAGGPVPVDSYHYVTYSCQSGTCIKSAEIATDCTTNAQCGSGQICDLSTMNYGKCITQKAEFCGDKICSSVGGETYQNCPADCQLSCPEGQQVIYETSNKGAFCIGGFGICEKSQIQYCGTPTTNWIYWIVIMIIIGLLIYFAKPILMTIRGFLPR